MSCGHSSCEQNNCNQNNCSTGKGNINFIILIVLYILLAIILGSWVF